MFIKDIIGGFTARREQQLSVGVAQNMFPETQPPESDLQVKRRVAMLPVHGYKTFDDTETVRVTGLESTREADERLVVANGRTLRVFTDQNTDAAQRMANSPIDFEGMDGQRLRPVLGAVVIGATYFVVCDDGQVRRDDGTVVLDSAALGGRTPLGMATNTNVVARIWLTFADDRVIRCWRLRGAVFEREAAMDIGVDIINETALESPESLWFDAAGKWMLVCDGIGGRLYEFAFDVDAEEPWRLDTRPGVQNAFDLQLLAGDPKIGAQEPLHVAGVYVSGNDISILERSKRRMHTINRNTALLTASVALPDYRDGDDADRTPCGFVGGLATATVYVNGRQYSNGRGRLWRVGSTAAIRNNLPDALQTTSRQTKLLPLGDEGRLVAWVVDRRLHLIDLRKNRLLQNVAGAIDSLAFREGAYIAVDATRGDLRVSEPGAILRESGLRIGSPEFGAVIRPSLFPRDTPREPLRSFYVGAGHIVGCLGRYSGVGLSRVAKLDVRSDAYVWDRGDIDAEPTLISYGSGTRFRRVWGVCAHGGTGADAGKLFILRERANQEEPPDMSFRDVEFAKFATVPTDVDGFFTPEGTPTNLTLTNPASEVRDIATDGEYLYVVEGAPDIRQMEVFNLTTGAKDDDRSFDDLNTVITEGLEVDRDPTATQPAGTDRTVQPQAWLRSVDVADGHVFIGIRLESGATIIRAFKYDGGWQHVPSRDITAGVTSDHRALTHDAKFLYDVRNTPINDYLEDGSPVERAVLAGYWLANPDRLSRYRWSPSLVNPASAKACAVLRRSLVSWSSTEMTIWTPRQGPGFPYRIASSRSVGLVAPDSIVNVEDVLHWIGKSAGGGLRVWRLGMEGDVTPQPINSKAVEELLDAVSETPGAIEGAIGWGDDTGGHPVAVFTMPRGGVTIAYDADADDWHTRTSLRLSGDDQPADWPFWWQRPTQGAQRITNSTLWRNRLTMGGYGKDGGIVAFSDFGSWLDIDGGAVERVRMASALNPERSDIKRPVLRVDCVYGVRGAGTSVADHDPRFDVEISDDGGRTFTDTRTVPLAPRGSRPPRPIYRLGHSQFRVYRVSCVAPVEFIILGAYQIPPEQVAWVHP